MMFIQKYKIPLAIAAAVLILGGLYIAFDKHMPGTTETPKSVELGNGTGIQVTGDATIKELPSEPLIPAPSLNRTVTFAGSSLPKEAQVAVKARIDENIDALKKDPSNLGIWFALGFELKQAGDYKGAEEMWLYVNTVADKDEPSALNLGDLYMNFLKEYPKAETFYKKALAVNAKNIDTYMNLFNLYRYLYKTDTTAAADIKAQALKVFPENADYINTWK